MEQSDGQPSPDDPVAGSFLEEMRELLEAALDHPWHAARARTRIHRFFTLA
jgi:hypothetical protein